MRLRTILVVAGVLGLLAALGCSDSNSPEEGTLQVRLIDAPGDFDAVNIVIESVQVHTSGDDSTSGWHEVSSIPGVYDLMELRNGVSALLVDRQLPAGNYTQMRLILGTGSTVVVDSVTYPLTIPSGLTSGLKLNHNFTIDNDAVYEVTLDFDAARSVRVNGTGEYRLQPVIRTVANIVSGALHGTVLPVDARAVIEAASATDTLTAWADTLNGTFSLPVIREGIYNLTIAPTAGAYQDTVLFGVSVTRSQDTDIGTITLHP